MVVDIDSDGFDVSVVSRIFGLDVNDVCVFVFKVNPPVINQGFIENQLVSAATEMLGSETVRASVESLGRSVTAASPARKLSDFIQTLGAPS